MGGGCWLEEMRALEANVSGRSSAVVVEGFWGGLAASVDGGGNGANGFVVAEVDAADDVENGFGLEDGSLPADPKMLAPRFEVGWGFVCSPSGEGCSSFCLVCDFCGLCFLTPRKALILPDFLAHAFLVHPKI